MMSLTLDFFGVDLTLKGHQGKMCFLYRHNLLDFCSRSRLSVCRYVMEIPLED